MESLLTNYMPAIASFGIIGGLLLVQLLVADIIGILNKQTPGTPIPADHSKLLFRAHRAHANTNESVAVFIALTLFAIAVSAPPSWLNTLCLVYIAGRLGHMLCYYANLKLLRSVFFGIATLALVGILAVGLVACLG
jgi:uncharacterized MAPEG superfamily protein